MLSRTLLTCCLLGFLANPSNASADPITYSEFLLGDLAPTPDVSPVFSLGIGVNTFSGQFRASPSTTDSDAIVFTVPAGSLLSLVQYALTAELLADTSNANTQYRLIEGTETFSFENHLAALVVVAQPPEFPLHVELNAFTSALPLRPGLYSVAHSFVGFGGLGQSEGFVADYKWSLTVERDVSAVPEPASLLLVAGGLGAILARARRHAKRDDILG